MPAEPICLASALPDEYFNYRLLSRGCWRKSEAFGPLSGVGGGDAGSGAGGCASPLYFLLGRSKKIRERCERRSIRSIS